MSTTHRGNMLNEITFEEHDGVNNAKRVNVVAGDINVSSQVTVQPLAAWPDPKTYIGLVTITGSLAPAAGNITLDDGSLTGIVGNVTLSDAKTFIGLTTTTLGASPAFVGIVTVANPSSFTGNITLDDGSLTGIIGNVTLSDSKGFIGLTTTTLGASPAFVGIVTVTNKDRTITGNVTLSDPKTFIGLTTTTLGASPAFVGIVTVTNRDRTITGNVTLSDAKTFIGLVTSVPAYGSGSTVYTGVISATGNTTVVVAPSSNRFFIKNLHISSLGRSEVEIRSGATTLIPFTSLSTTSGYAAHYGEMGLPSRAQQDALVINLNGGATVSYMANLRFEA